eukprot:CAMPEP_0185846092 /NCGR_PEP_ID=MMETSP1354-20130828/1845_1 /TAXON_ID=708628 /ORGANISM="Erythrolobus madagascarensis, Strain CCMP3276" /LENGTH=670 /DNA_ID=CAMNT_0028546175 /DNA_START=415 /DNA_END=2427 /DNA_ORIENTATION=-
MADVSELSDAVPGGSDGAPVAEVTSTVVGAGDSPADGGVGGDGANATSGDVDGSNGAGEGDQQKKGGESEAFVLTPEQEDLLKQKLKRTPEPSKQELATKVDAKKAEIQACFDQIKQGRDAMDKRAKIAGVSKEEFAVAKRELDEVLAQLRALFETKKNLTAQIKELREAGGRRGDAGGSATGGSASEQALMRKIKNSEDLEARIQELEERQSSQSMSISEEKRLIQDLAFLKHKGRAIIAEEEKSRKQNETEKEIRFKQRDELEAERKALDAQIDELQPKVDAERAKVDKVREKQNEIMESVSKEVDSVDREALKKKIADLREEIKVMYDVHHAAYNEWKANEKLIRDQQYLIKRIKFEQTKAEKEARRLEREAELAKYPPPDPYEAEKGMCDNLSNYLRAFLPGAEGAESSAVPSGPGTKGEKLVVAALSGKEAKVMPSRDLDTKGKRIGKNVESDESEDKYAAFGKATKKKGKGKGNQAASSAAGSDAVSADNIKLPPHPVDRFVAFQKLGIKPPTVRSEIPGVLEELKRKREYYDSAPEKKASDSGEGRREKPSKAVGSKSGAAGSSSASGSSSKAPTEFVFDHSDSPALNGSAAAAPVDIGGGDPTRPSFSDIIQGRATAAAQAPAVSLSASDAMGMRSDGLGSGLAAAEMEPAATSSTAAVGDE